MKNHGNVNQILYKKVNHTSDFASINYGSSFHKGHRANVILDTNEIAIGNEFPFDCLKKKIALKSRTKGKIG